MRKTINIHDLLAILQAMKKQKEVKKNGQRNSYNTKS